MDFPRGKSTIGGTSTTLVISRIRLLMPRWCSAVAASWSLRSLPSMVLSRVRSSPRSWHADAYVLAPPPPPLYSRTGTRWSTNKTGIGTNPMGLVTTSTKGAHTKTVYNCYTTVRIVFVRIWLAPPPLLSRFAFQVVSALLESATTAVMFTLIRHMVTAYTIVRIVVVLII